MQNFDAQFDDLAGTWWDLEGPCKPLHALNPTRLKYITDFVNLANKSVLDLGCGGGILSESLSELGGYVTGVDPADNLIKTASYHSKKNNLDINYIKSTAEDYLKNNQDERNSFDIITCMELLEHVADPIELIKVSYELVKKNGIIFFSTINRTLRAYLLGILGAEYLFKLLPVGTHEYSKFIRPSELAKVFRNLNLKLLNLSGVDYNPVTNRATITSKVDINYILCVKKQ